jgi:hypothetical protein
MNGLNLQQHFCYFKGDLILIDRRGKDRHNGEFSWFERTQPLSSAKL